MAAPFARGRGGPGGWLILPEPGLSLPDAEEISPDLAGWRRDRRPALPTEGSVTVVPDWVCEVLSPTTRRHDALVKVPYYARVGVAHLWLVDLDARLVTALHNTQGTWTVVGTFGDETAAAIPPFEAVGLDLLAWWAELGPPSEG